MNGDVPCCRFEWGLERAKRADKPGSVRVLPPVIIIPLGAALLPRSSNLPVDSASNLNAYCLVLLRMGFTLPATVTSAAVRSYRTFSPLPDPLAGPSAVQLSVALSVGSRRPAVSRHSALWSPDFPPPCCHGSDDLSRFAGAIIPVHRRGRKPRMINGRAG